MCLKILLLPETILRLALYRLRRVCFVQRVLCWDNQVCSILLCSVSSSWNVLTYHLNSFYSFLFTILVSCLNLFRTSQDTKPAKWQGPLSRPQKEQALFKGFEIPVSSRRSCFYLSSDPAKWRWLFRNQLRLKSLSSSNCYLTTTATFFDGQSYIASCLNLSTTTTIFCPQSSRCGERFICINRS